ncbi:D-glycero-alpha-D-manno-heptose-1,7-bisphosphate 7-phosphatase [Paucidesulfovibrio longus]|uniref:D-glycero-alpha-D-manno-heptose-1,7-bisphosphate 7-phosphatase n=1 Tax=Paucidesulfovibrio longus TaxID=889 RepID=UPI00041224D6|nr:HAD family hydrolase [Paucidesulfovibrio longus]
MSALILLDRDGTLIKEKNYLSDPDEVELLPGAAQGLLRLKSLGCKLAVVSNQSGVGRGFFTPEDVARCNARLAELLAAEGVELDAVYFCPHGPDEACECRKPSPGMGWQACKDLGLPPEKTFVIGDKPCDVDLGTRLGARSVLVSTGYGAESLAACRPDFASSDLMEAADWIAVQLKADARKK